MGATTKIEWLGRNGSTWNPWYGCSKVSPGCDNCYAERWAKRAGKPWGKPSIASQRTFESPLRWKEPRRIFPCSLSDVFHPDLPPTWRDRAWEIIAQARQHRYLILTKRPENIAGMLPHDWAQNFGHVWLGVTAENQEQAERRIPLLLSVPAAGYFVSLEPLLGSLNLRSIRTGPDRPMEAHSETTWHPCGDALRKPLPLKAGETRLVGPRWTGIDWVIVGGETGPGARPMDPDWARDIRDQCQQAGVPFFFKSWGEWSADARNYKEKIGRASCRERV